MQFEDIAHKYAIREMGRWGVSLDVKACLVKLLSDEGEVLIGYFRDDVMARNVALALEYYKEHNKA